MIKLITGCYANLFGRVLFRKWNYFFLKLGMKGLGFLNYETFKISGEKYFLEKILSNYKINNIFDVGANVGSYALLLQKHFENSEIFCFEPHPNTFIKLKNNTENLPNIHIHNVGFSNENTEALLFDYANSEGSSHATLYNEAITTITQASSKATKINLLTLDNFLTDNPGIKNISFLKIDTEGNEHKVLLGAKEALQNKKIDILQFEIGTHNIISKVHFRDFILVLKDYNLYRLLPKGILKLNYSMPYVDEIIAFQNIIAIRKDIDING